VIGDSAIMITYRDGIGRRHPHRDHNYESRNQEKGIVPGLVQYRHSSHRPFGWAQYLDQNVRWNNVMLLS
ncbi:hypothetical protein BaRGS_00031783, partial [Batillaria attramentaria]